jgi:ABC-2 type transport system permease protein
MSSQATDLLVVSDAVEPACRPPGSWTIVLLQELRDLWVWGGRALTLAFAFSVLLSVIAYLTAINKALNFLEQREAVNLIVQVGIGVGALLALLLAADSISGERERSTLEQVLVTPVPRVRLVTGKLLAALSLWLAAFIISVPYLVYLARGVGVTGPALAAMLIVGSLVAVFFASLAMLISIFSNSNRVSLSVSLFLLLALFAPMQLPAGATKGAVGSALVHVNPFSSGLRYIGSLVVDGQAWTDGLIWVVSPIVAAVIFGGIALLCARFVTLRGSVSK